MRIPLLLGLLFYLSPLAGQTNCQITDLNVDINATAPSFCAFTATVDFKHQGTTNQFNLNINGVDYGNFPYSALPLTLPPINNNHPSGIYQFVVTDAVFSGCSAVYTAQVPVCVPPNCDITNFAAVPDTCTSDSTYLVTITFNGGVANGLFSVYAAPGIFLGNYPVSQLPVTVNYPWSGNPIDFVTVCLVGSPNCCASDSITAPACLPGNPCAIKDLVVKPDTCTSDSTYTVHIDFDYQSPLTVIDSFFVFANDSLIGKFGTDQLPLSIADFPWGKKLFDRVRICLEKQPNCCKEVQIVAPDCLNFGPCMVMGAKIEVGPCNTDSTYTLFVNFQATNPGLGTFTIEGSNGVVYGPFKHSEAPVTIPNFPWNGQNDDFIRICVQTDTTLGDCCETFKFQTPDCPATDVCEIYDLVVDPGACVPGTTGYSLFINFKVKNPGNDFFEVFTANGQFVGVYKLSDLPLTIPVFPGNGTAPDKVRVCINDMPNCCAEATFQAPNCPPGGCDITDLAVQTGTCTSNSTYQVWVNFNTNANFAVDFGVWANGNFLGAYPLSSLPLKIDSFPWNGGNKDEIKVCILTPNSSTPLCCESLAFDVPGCLNNNNCEIDDLEVEVGGCTSDSTYVVELDFEVDNPGAATTFDVYANGAFFKTYPLSSLPLKIDSFPWDGGMKDVIKICVNTANVPPGAACCETVEYKVPACLLNPNGCLITDFDVAVGNCTSDSTYKVTIDFWIDNPTSNKFNVYSNGQFVGAYLLADLPVTINNFPWGGGTKDELKVCVPLQNDPAQFGCCYEVEYNAPNCLKPCEIFDFSVEVDDCTSDSTYTIWIDFEVVKNNTNSNSFGVWANGVFLGLSNLSQLPLKIEDFPWGGGNKDLIKVCIVNANTMYACCAEKNIEAPDCLTNPGCAVDDLVVDPGACTSDSTYQLWVNFKLKNGPSGVDSFAVFANGDFIGNYPLNQLPLKIEDFPWNGGNKDVIKICVGTPNDPAFCCETLEFKVPDCLTSNPCEIVDLVVDPGACTSDSTYNLVVNFEVINPGSATQFGLWANGQFVDFFYIDSLPITIEDFLWGGGSKDEIKVCLNNANSGTTCCKTIEFAAPGCLNSGDCEIFDLQVLLTPCLCGQFFAIFTFEHQNGSPDGFEIVGVGQNFGTFPYNYPQPIILGPFDGDGVTNYEFAVLDLDDPNCDDAEDVGIVTCTTITDNPNEQGALMQVSPNPAVDFVFVQVQMPGGQRLQQTDVQVVASDGRQVRFETVGDGTQFALNVADLPAGLYHMVLNSAFGQVGGNFVKQ